MRLFIALEIPEPVREEMTQLMGMLKGRLPKARWVRPEGMHLTLAFLGERPDGDVGSLQEALSPVFSGHAPFTAKVMGGGTFPPGRPARVAWIGVEAGPVLLSLQREVAAAVAEALDVEPERRPFHPHLTVARPAQPWPKDAIASFAAATDRSFGEPFEVGRGVLLESHLGPGGARYEEKAVFPLGDG